MTTLLIFCLSVSQPITQQPAIQQPQAITYAEELEIIRKDYQEYGSSARYLYSGKLPLQKRLEAETALKMLLPHLTFNPVLEQQSPYRFMGTWMYRIDIDRLGWGHDGWCQLALEYPYETFFDPLVLRTEWLLQITSDASNSQSYYNLLYNKNQSRFRGIDVCPPTNRTDILKIFGVTAQNLKVDRTGIILDRGKSGVADDTRLIAHTPLSTGHFWETFDSDNAVFDKDPAEHLIDGKLKFDGQELIFSIPKHSTQTGDRTFVQAYLLTNDKGKKIDEASTAFVIDHTSFRKEPTIRTPGSCIMCHGALNGPSENLVRRWIEEGVIISTLKKEDPKRIGADFLQFFYLSKHGLLIDRANEDYNTLIHLTTSQWLEPKRDGMWRDVSSMYRSVIEFYDEPVTLEQAALEVYAVDANEVRNALAYWSELQGPLPFKGRISALPHAFPIARRSWEGQRFNGYHSADNKPTIKNSVKVGEPYYVPGAYHYTVDALNLWRKKK